MIAFAALVLCLGIGLAVLAWAFSAAGVDRSLHDESDDWRRCDEAMRRHHLGEDR